MKKSLGLKICAGIAVVSALAFLPGKTYALNSSLKVGDDILFQGSASSSPSANLDRTATYDPSSKTLIIDGAQSEEPLGPIVSDISGLVISIVSDATIDSESGAAITSDGGVTISSSAGKTLTVKGDAKISGSFILQSGNIDLGKNSLTVNEANLKIQGGSINAGSIVLKDTNASSQAKIQIENDTKVKVAEYIKASYSFAAADKGIALGDKICANPAAVISNINGTGAEKVSTVFTNDANKNGITSGLSLSAEACEEVASGESIENPNTLDMVYVYAAILVASSAMLGYRRYIAKR